MSNYTKEEDRLVDLEAKFTHAEQAIHDLSDMVREQWDQIEQLKHEVRRLEDRTSELEQRPGATGREESEKPPHY